MYRISAKRFKETTMSEYSPCIPMCDNHHSDAAQVLCRFHKELLCLSCVLKGVKSKECSSVEIRKISGEKDVLLLDCLVVRQIAMKKKQLIDKYESKTETIKGDLKEQVMQTHDRLCKRLDEMKDNCLKTIELQAKALEEENELDKRRLDTLEITLNEYINSLSENSFDDTNCILSNLKEVKTEIMKNIPDKDTEPEGHFEPNSILGDFIFQPGTSLGRVSLTDPDLYEEVGDYSENKLEMRTQVTQSSTQESGIHPYIDLDKESDIASDRFLMSVSFSSDEIVYKDTPLSAELESHGTVTAVQKSTEIGTEKLADITKHLKQKLLDKTSDLGSHAKTKSLEAKSETRLEGLLRWWSLDSKRPDKSGGLKIARDAERKDGPCKSNSRGKKAENNYHSIGIATTNFLNPNNLINKTVVLSELKQHIMSACKFSKVVSIGDGCLGLLSEVHNTFVLVSLNGRVLKTKTMLEGLKNAVALGKNEVALLIDNGRQIRNFDVSRGNFTTTECFVVDEEFTKITGLDFDEASSLFAISSPDKLVIFDKSGVKVQSDNYSSGNAPDEVATAFDFKKDCLYILNIQNGSLKCFSFKTSSWLWKCKYKGRSFAPRTMCLFKDTIYLACRGEIAMLLAEDGSLFGKHDIKRLLDDCLAMCLIDDVIAVTSNSDDLDESMKLAFTGIDI